MSFEKLMAELKGLESEQETMSKALPAGEGEDDKNIQAAAAEGGDMVDDEGGEGGEPAADDTTDDEPLGKSLGVVTLPNGEKAEAVDGTELVKSLISQVEQLGAKQTESEGNLFKAIETTVGLLKSQGEILKSMQAEIAKLRGEGRGRKTMLSITDKPDAGTQMAKSEPAGVTAEEFLVKSHAAFDAKKISGLELATIDVALRQNKPGDIDPSLIQKVLS